MCVYVSVCERESERVSERERERERGRERERERERETLLADSPLAAWAGRKQGSREKAVQCHKGIALSLFVTIGMQERNIVATAIRELALGCPNPPPVACHRMLQRTFAR